MAVIVIFGLLGHLPTLTVLWLPLLMVILLGMAVGLGLMLGVINVFIRDIGQVVPIVLQIWFWLTPVVYAAQMLPAGYRSWLLLNPMTGLVMGYQDILVYGRTPGLLVLVYPALLAMVTLGGALLLYRRASEDMADVL